MATNNLNSRVELITLLADASNRMHASVDLPSIMRVAAATSIKLLGAAGGAVGLVIEHEVAFSECSDGESWSAMQCRFGGDGWLSDLIAHRKVVVINEADVQKNFAAGDAPVLAEAKCLVAVPVIGKEDDLLACLLIINPNETSGIKLELEPLALMMSSAIENSIRYAESRRVEADLEKSVATYRTLVEQIPAITYIASLDRSRILFVSPQVETILGYSQDDFLAHQEHWIERVHPEDADCMQAKADHSINHEDAFHCEYRMRTNDGGYVWVKDAADVVRDHDHDLYLQGVIYDISESKATEQKMTQLAHFDQLTGLANRSLFLDRLSQAVAQSKRHQQKFAVLFLDLDGFKAVNDNMGHKAGDELLAEAAHRLKSQVREADTVARMGGDEFTIILRDITSQKGVHKVAEKLIKAISEPYDHMGAEHVVTLSMGVSLYPDDSTDHDELISFADNAMYKAKKGGKNHYRFHHLDKS